MKKTKTRALFILFLFLLSTSLVGQDTPKDYITQTLEPTPAKLQRPKNWFYTESHRGSAFQWTIAAEDPRNGKGYETGVKIQTFFDVKKNLDTSPRQFVQDFIEERKRNKNVEVLGVTPETKVGPCRLISMQSIEGTSQIIHQLYFGTGDLDVVSVAILGAPNDGNWKKNIQVLAKINRFDLSRLLLFDPSDTFEVDEDVLSGPLTKLGFQVVPLKRTAGGLLILNARINEGQELSFLCDTGAVSTTVSPTVSEVLKLTSWPRDAEIVGAGRVTQSRIAEIDSINVGGTSTGLSQVIVADLAIFRSKQSPKIQGILGADWLRLNQAVIDEARGRLFFKSPRKK